MTQTTKTPAGTDPTGVSRVRLEGWMLPLDNLVTTRLQFQIAAHHVRPELARLCAALAFKGGGCDGYAVNSAQSVLLGDGKWREASQ